MQFVYYSKVTRTRVWQSDIYTANQIIAYIRLSSARHGQEVTDGRELQLHKVPANRTLCYTCTSNIVSNILV